MRSVLLAAALAIAAPVTAQDLTMIMVEQAGCIYCERWDAEAAPGWPNTEVGRAAPLRRVDLGALPEDVAFVSRPVFTPTFVLVRDGAEIARVEGYDPQFFWPMVERIVADARESDG